MELVVLYNYSNLVQHCYHFNFITKCLAWWKIIFKKSKKMAKQTTNLNSEVTDFLDEQNHPFRKEIEQLRNYILSANNDLTENIKWNGPNYCFKNDDRITMKIQPPKNIQLIFHRGAKKQKQPKDKLIEDNSKLLTWKENDRAIATFNNITDIEGAKKGLTEIVKKWINATK